VLAPPSRNSVATAGVNVDFPLCREARHEAAVRRVLTRCAGVLLDRLPPGKLVALVLTGSFARGEGSVIATPDGPRVLGDIEFLVVLPTEVEFHQYRKAMTAWAQEAAVAAQADLRVDIEFGPVEMGYLRRRARPSIFVSDLIRHGKVVWGASDVVRVVPPFETKDIPREDALHLLFNRTIEQLEAYDRALTLDGEALWDLAYQRVKLLLDLAGSALAFRGRHESSYEARPRAFAHLLAETPALAAALPHDFQGELTEAARLKIAPGDGTAVLPAHLGLDRQRQWIRERIVSGIAPVSAFLRWELAELLGSEAALPELVARYAMTPTLGRRVWDWAKMTLHPLPPPLPLARWRSARLFLRSTPRTLLYASATLSYLNLDRPTVPLGTIARLLFVRRRALGGDAEAHRRAITALWRWCVRNN
jgi:hypothetical protein